MTRKRLLLIVNAFSGRKASKYQILEALQEFSYHNYQVEIYMTQGRMDAHHYVLKYGSQFDIIAVSGGDGTLNEVTSAMVTLIRPPLLAYFPTGTMNDFGTNFKLTSDFKETAKKICAGHTEEFDMGKINRRYFNYVAGFGAFCDVSYETDQNLKSRFGNMAYILKGISTLPNLRPHHVRMTLDDQVIEKDIMFGLIINGVRVAGFDLMEKNENSMKDGIFDILIVEHTPNFLELINYPLGMLNPSVSRKYVERYKAHSIYIQADDPMKWTLDGEEGKQCAIATIENMPRALKIIC